MNQSNYGTEYFALNKATSATELEAEFAFSAKFHANFTLDGCIVWNARNTVLGEEALLINIVPVCYVKTGRYGKS